MNIRTLVLLVILAIVCPPITGGAVGFHTPFGSSGGGGTATDITFDNTEASLTGDPDDVQTAIEAVKTEIDNITAGGLADIDDLPGDTVDDNKIDSSLINVATSTGTGVASFPNTTFTVSTAGAVSIKAEVFQPYSAALADFSDASPTGTYDLSGANITFGLEASDIPDISETYQTADAVLAALAALANGSGVLTNDGSGGLSWVAGGGSVTTSSPIGNTAFTDLAAGNTYTNYGDVTDDTINELFAAIDASWPSGSGAPTDASYLTAGANATLSDERVVSADGLSLIQAADFATMRDSMGVQASDTNLTNIAANWTVDVFGNVSGMGTIEPTPSEHPQAVLYDSDAPGSTTAEKAMAYLWGEYVDGADDVENSSAGIAARAAGAWFDWIWYDKTVDQVKVTRDLDVDGFILAHSSMGVEERINFYDSEELVAQITGKNDGVGVSQLTFSVLMGSTMTDFFTPCGNCGLTHFWKPIALPASTTSLASLNIPSGTAPSSPAEGDMYYDGTHLYFKPSGDAVDLLAAASGEMVYPSGTGIAVVSGGTAWGTTLTAPSGTIVGTSDTQTLTNKTIGDGTTPVRIVYDPTPATDATVSGDLISVETTAGLNAVAGDLVCVVNTGGTDGPIVALADADHADKVGAVFLITESISAENAGKALISGIMRLDSWDWSGVNKSLFIGTTAGDMTETAPSAAGQYVQKMGYSLSPDVILFRPSVDIGVK